MQVIFSPYFIGSYMRNNIMEYVYNGKYSLRKLKYRALILLDTISKRTTTSSDKKILTCVQYNVNIFLEFIDYLTIIRSQPPGTSKYSSKKYIYKLSKAYFLRLAI